MTILQALRESSSIILLGPQEQYFGSVPKNGLDSLRLAGLRIGASFIEFTVSANSQAKHYMYSIDDFTLVGMR